MIALLAVLAAFIDVSAFLGITIYFPSELSPDETILYHRLLSVRLAVFATFFYYAVLNFTRSSMKFYPVRFLKIFLFTLTFIGILIFKDSGKLHEKYDVIVFFGLSALMLRIASRPKIKKYFFWNNNISNFCKL